MSTAKEDLRPHRRLIDVPLNPYGDERLPRLLRLLRPAPLYWITRAQQIVFEASVLTDRQVAKLGRKLESDAVFRARFDADPIAAAEALGMRDLARGLEREIRGLIALAERIAKDDAYRAAMEADPVAALRAQGLPAAAAEPLSRALGVKDEAVANMPEVVAHKHEPLPRTARLLILLVGSTAVVERIRSGSRSS
jgi:putative modified peptide